MNNLSINTITASSHSKTYVAHCDIVLLMIIAHDSPNGWTAATWDADQGQ